jgi:hypothetical protein
VSNAHDRLFTLRSQLDRTATDAGTALAGLRHPLQRVLRTPSFANSVSIPTFLPASVIDFVPSGTSGVFLVQRLRLMDVQLTLGSRRTRPLPRNYLNEVRRFSRFFFCFFFFFHR